MVYLIVDGSDEQNFKSLRSVILRAQNTTLFFFISESYHHPLPSP